MTPLLKLRLAARQAQWRWIDRRAQSTERLVAVREVASGRVDRFWAGVHNRRRRPWRRLDPGVLSWETAFGPVIDEFAPDLIHANDFWMLAVGARAKVRAAAAGRDVRLVWDAHEFLPGLKPWSPHERWRDAQIALEREFVPDADAVVTVTDQLADLLVTEHGLSERPTVVANAPVLGEPQAGLGTIREALGLDDDLPLLTYCGGIAVQRGLETVVRGLADLPGAHLALVVPSLATEYGRHLLTVATEVGVRDRVHGHPYVAPDQIVRFLSTADVGVIPLHHVLNHELSLPTKYFEFSHARLPIVTSDCEAMAEAVTETGQGEVFVAEDVADFVRATRAVLADPDRYRRAYDDVARMRSWTWDAQAERLVALYASALDRES